MKEWLEWLWYMCSRVLIIWLVFTNIILFAAHAGLDRRLKSPHPTGRHFLELELNNPYRFGVELEVKCDWNNKKKEFEFRKFYFIKPGKSLNIRFPKYYSSCQVWPSHAWNWVEEDGGKK